MHVCVRVRACVYLCVCVCVLCVCVCARPCCWTAYEQRVLPTLLSSLAWQGGGCLVNRRRVLAREEGDSGNRAGWGLPRPMRAQNGGQCGLV